MDKTDLKLLAALDVDARASFNQLGKIAHISKEAAQYRFKQLLKRQILTGFFAFIDVAKMGYQTNKILIKYKSVTGEMQREIVRFVQQNQCVAWAGLCEGAWDLVLTTICKDSAQFVGFYEDFLKKFGSHFREKQVLIPIDNPVFNDKYLSQGDLIYNKRLDFHAKENEMDKKDRVIITELSKDARRSYTQIGQKVGLSYWAVAQRMKRLARQGVIVLFKPRIDFRKLGYSYYHLFIELENNGSKDRIMSFYKAHKGTVMLMNHIGGYSMHIEFVVHADEFPGILVELREKFGKDIARYEPLGIREEYVMNLLR